MRRDDFGDGAGLLVHRPFEVLSRSARVVPVVEFFVLPDGVRGVVGHGGREAALVDRGDAGPFEGALFDRHAAARLGEHVLGGEA
ncbi:hypothetical protein SFR_1615 [Streptomyces sp. FR-008]|nr:hypothetical protein SFR_1615 [Streptomyces sp. FR-008]